VVAMFAYQRFLACLKYESGFIWTNSACHDDSTSARQNVVCLTRRRSNGQSSVREENQSKVWFQMWNPCVKIQYRRIATGNAPEWLGETPVESRVGSETVRSSHFSTSNMPAGFRPTPICHHASQDVPRELPLDEVTQKVIREVSCSA